MTTDPSKTTISKQDIITAATELFLLEGYESVSMRKIASKVECSSTNLYNHFKNKDEILLYMLKDGNALFFQYLIEAERSHAGEDVMHRLRAAFKAYVRFGLEHRSYYKLMFIDNLCHYDNLVMGESERMRGFQALVTLIAEAMESNRIRTSAQTMQVSGSAWAMLHGITSLFITFDTFGWTDHDAMIDFHIDAYFKGLERM